MLKRVIEILLCMALAIGSSAQTYSLNDAVQVGATVQSTPPRITITWKPFDGATGYSIFRKLKEGDSWGTAIGTTSGTTYQYMDDGVTVGTYYEYKVTRAAATTATGYVASGIGLAPVENRGRMLLLVDSTLATGLVDELIQLQKDLRLDGWKVTRSDVGATASVTSVKSLIVSAYNADPTNVKALYLLGHIPVPYSGKLNPDGHSEHLGAWSCDGYYGDMDGTWTDNTLNWTGAQQARNDNIPGDGKFDQNNFPTEVELQVGRVDLHAMPAFSQSELELTRAYLNKAHAYKTGQLVPQRRGIVFDNFQYITSPLAASGYRSISALVGSGQITDAYPYAYSFHSQLDGESYLWTYASGGGTWTSASNVATTADYAAIDFGGIFNMSFGSYFGDWDVENDFLRATIASGDGLTNVWSGIPNWFFHHMGMGDNIGYSAKVTMNNTSLYTPQSGGWQGPTYDRVHLGLMGDPSLRMTVVSKPSTLHIGNNAGVAEFTWASATGDVDGYYVYERNASTGVLLRLNETPILQSTYSNAAIPYVSGKQYMVRAVKLQVTNTGTFQDLSLGAEAVAPGAPLPDCNGVVGGSVVPGSSCDDGDPATINDVIDPNCQCAGTAVLLDCAGTPNGPAVPGTACNDNNVNTGADTWSTDCECIGQLIDCQGNTGGSALPGIPCDDGDPLTNNEVWDMDCTCSGDLVDCAGVVGGSAILDECGSCTGGTTGLLPNVDEDGDGLLACEDNCVTAFNPDQIDTDEDGIGDVCDNCALIFNPDQADHDGNGVGDACEMQAHIAGQLSVGTGLTIYPIPARDHIDLRCENPEAYSIEIFEPSGRSVRECMFEPRIGISAMARGSYVVVVYDKDRRILGWARMMKI